MNFLRKHWYDVGGFLSIPTLLFIYFNQESLTRYEQLMWLSLVSLFFHQMEEYRIVGTFPGMVNSILEPNNKLLDRYPLNTNSALYVNVFFGWGAYLGAALLGERAIWFGMAAVIVSLGNTLGHTTLFNIKGKTLYNAGLATSWIFFAPIVYFFFIIVQEDKLARSIDYWIGIPLGVVLNYVGILKIIDWMKDKNTAYIFEQRNLLVKDRNKNIP
jgi:hypothetical protein